MHLRKDALGAAAQFVISFFGYDILERHNWNSIKAASVFAGAGRIRKTQSTITTIAEACQMELNDYYLFVDRSFCDDSCPTCKASLTRIREMRSEHTAEGLAEARQMIDAAGKLQMRPGLRPFDSRSMCSNISLVFICCSRCF